MQDYILLLVCDNKIDNLTSLFSCVMRKDWFKVEYFQVPVVGYVLQRHLCKIVN